MPCIRFSFVILKQLNYSSCFVPPEFRLIAVRYGDNIKELRLFFECTRLVCLRRIVFAATRAALEHYHTTEVQWKDISCEFPNKVTLTLQLVSCIDSFTVLLFLQCVIKFVVFYAKVTLSTGSDKHFKVFQSRHRWPLRYRIRFLDPILFEKCPSLSILLTVLKAFRLYPGSSMCFVWYRKLPDVFMHRAFVTDDSRYCSIYYFMHLIFFYGLSNPDHVYVFSKTFTRCFSADCLSTF